MTATTASLPAELIDFISNGEEDTRAYGRRLAAALPRPCVVLLAGNLGAGKTTMVKGLAEGLGVAREEDVASPSYTLIHEYHGDSVSLYHIDLYRLDTPEQVATLGLEDLLGFEIDPHAIVVVEWGTKFSSWWIQERVEVELEPLEEDRRRIRARWVQPAKLATGSRPVAS